MSSDALSAIAADDLSRSLMGWQFTGWQFEIPHAPLSVAFPEPGALPTPPPGFAPIPSHAPAIAGEAAPSGEPAPEPLPAQGDAASASQARVSINDDGVSRDGAASGLSAPPGQTSAIAPASEDTSAPGSVGVGGTNAAFAPDQPAGSIPGIGNDPVEPQEPAEPTEPYVPDFADVFEFNIIFQLNVLLDSDFVVQQIASASDASLYGLGFGQFAFTGGNTQSNTATIMDAGGYEDFGWLGGSYYETNAIYSLNALDDGDIAFNLVPGGSAGAQSIMSGGNAQSNDATIISLTDGGLPVPDGVQIGAADTVEYNITTQINFMDDSDAAGQLIHGSGGGSQTAGTGGNTQSNTALLIDDNTPPEQAVAGNYYEYNLIIQQNVMDDSDHVGQFAAASAANPQNEEAGLLLDDEAFPYGMFADALA